jgi:hypothetical protein
MYEFPPPRQRGLLLHGFFILVLLAVLIIALWQVFQVSVGPSFTIYVVLALGSFIGLPFLGYARMRYGKPATRSTGTIFELNGGCEEKMFPSPTWVGALSAGPVHA